jgi:hypothetical protein
VVDGWSSVGNVVIVELADGGTDEFDPEWGDPGSKKEKKLCDIECL